MSTKHNKRATLRGAHAATVPVKAAHSTTSHSMSDQAIQHHLQAVPVEKGFGVQRPAPRPDDVAASAHSVVDAQTSRWIADHARAGVSYDAVLNALTSNGWQVEPAQAAIQASLAKHCPGFVLNPRMAEFHAYVVPEPVMVDGARFVDCGDRVAEVVMTSLLPRVIVLDGFLDDAECDQLAALAEPRMEPSTVIEVGTGSSVLNSVRTSTGMFFGLQENALVTAVERRIAHCLNWPIECGEGIQVLNYQPGAEYQPHQDYFDPVDPGTPRAIGFAGQRVATLLMYLNTPERGGSTVFPDGGLEVQAKKGRAVFFSYDQPTEQKRARHGGAPVIAGEKWVATKWLRQKPWQPMDVPSPARSA